MPQMAPINWLSLFFMFMLTFIMFNLMNYFSFNINNNNKINNENNKIKYYINNNNNNNKMSNWKW